ncbi:response regulator receiver modulated metal dependent phosphohydrolase [Methylorubrum populi BJ001]|jgi:putative two-component system response regulator|uniref:Response regulator receiver modulated metal dependent phosphohydrolase n=1 Tax=Methylorubrum populi (strain ATCC BAA-705 / NCIMB 13946 / BJ001) TaxID=441620 RepID=B1ZLZ0_METPB|nr:HD domain-containing phosphohydrolase [Methylorubrum populi]ACB83059.1 response regulator receiver modulated metal dependent phosphohydrolase [Methylorubrum populi BJ001]OAH30858.1 phosphohydrolase [Methylorubrum populi]PZP71055.1 MAG: HD domain-containing protein [Methylorubrum populi]QDI83068.1 HD domain-containing protein [Methylorubrum populi]
MTGGAEASEDAVVAIVAARTPAPLVLALRGQPLSASIVAVSTHVIEDLVAEAPAVIVVEAEPERFDAPALVRSLRAQESLARTPVLLVAGGDARSLRRLGREAGATDVLPKPFDALELQDRVGVLIDLALARRENDRRARTMRRDAAQASAEAVSRERELIRRLMLAAEFRDDRAGDHLTRVAGCVIAVAEGLGLSAAEADDVALASTMHDIGKIAVPDHILMKAGPLTPEEWDEMRQHALRGYHMLHDSPSRLLQIAAEIALTHHERWDGTGYPRGLRGEEIPRSGRIVAVADVFDALISARSYKPAWSLERARAHLEAEAGRHFDPACVAAFLSRWEDIVALVEEQAA